MNKFLASLLALLSLAFMTTGALGAVVNYSFTVSGAKAPAGAGGSFSIESTAGTTNDFGEAEFKLLSFSFVFGPQSFDLQGLDGDEGVAIFDGVNLRGLEAVGDQVQFTLMPGTADTSPFLVWNGPRLSTFDLSFQIAGSSVPEPGTLWLAPIALLAAWPLRRRADARYIPPYVRLSTRG